MSSLGGLVGCPATSDEVRPPLDQLFFPSGVAISPDENLMFVSNANSELRFDSGTVLTLDIAAADALATAWLATGQVPADPAGCENCCEVDSTSSGTLVCNERAVVLEGGTVRLGNFSTAIGLQPLDDGTLRLLVPVRGDPSVTWIDATQSGGAATRSIEMDCGGSGSAPLCDNDHRMIRIHDDIELPGLASEPWGIFVDPANEYAMLSHLTFGTATLINTPRDGSPPAIVDALGGLFGQNPQSGIRGATGIAGRSPGSADDLIYVTSRAEGRVQILHPETTTAGRLVLVPGEFFFLDRILPSDDARGIAFSPDGNSAYVISRDPPSLQTIDTSIGDGGFPVNNVVSAVEICRQASMLTRGDSGDGDRLYISCFQDSRVWVVDPIRGNVDAVIDVGRGAHISAFAAGRGRLYVTNFLEDTISVIDVAVGSATRNRVVLQLGRERQLGGE